MLPLATIQTIALSIFGFVGVTVITGFISANVRRLANEKGHDAYLLKLWNMLPEWGHKLLSGWQPLRQLWWIWLCLGLSGGLGGALWLLSIPQPAVSTLSLDALTKAAAEAKAQQAADDQKQISDAQDAARMARAAKEAAEHKLDAASNGTKSPILGLDDAKSMQIVRSLFDFAQGTAPCKGTFSTENQNKPEGLKAYGLIAELYNVLRYTNGWTMGWGDINKSFLPPGASFKISQPSGHERECALKLKDLFESLNIAPISMKVEDSDDLLACKCFEVSIGKLESP
jgi:hypothetical protein